MRLASLVALIVTLFAGLTYALFQAQSHSAAQTQLQHTTPVKGQVMRHLPVQCDAARRGKRCEAQVVASVDTLRWTGVVTLDHSNAEYTAQSLLREHPVGSSITLHRTARGEDVVYVSDQHLRRLTTATASPSVMLQPWPALLLLSALVALIALLRPGYGALHAKAQPPPRP